MDENRHREVILENCSQIREYLHFWRSESDNEVIKKYEEHCYTLLFEIYQEGREILQQPSSNNQPRYDSDIENLVGSLGEMLSNWLID